MSKVKDLYEKYKEIILYIIFGVATTAVGWIVYFTILWTWRSAFSIAPDDTTSSMYLTGYTVAQVVQWVAAVLFAFFTNRKWVFTKAEKNVSVVKQLLTFSAGRVATFFVDYLVTYFGALALLSLFPSLSTVSLFGREWNFCDIISKVIAAVLVIICNYIFSKLFVFKNKKKADTQNTQ